MDGELSRAREELSQAKMRVAELEAHAAEVQNKVQKVTFVNAEIGYILSMSAL